MKKALGDLNGRWVLLFKFCMVLFTLATPSLSAAIGYSFIVLRDHDQRIKGIEASSQERMFMVDDFRNLRDTMPPKIERALEQLAGVKEDIAEIKQMLKDRK